jgi:hypothetical protein
MGCKMTVRTTINAERAQTEYGISADHECMETGELQFRLIGSDGNGYSRTVATKNGGWQNSHSHSAFQELYLVESGWIALATPSSTRKSPHIRVLREGTSRVTLLGQVHNVYLSANTVIHTIRFGVRGAQPRWEAAPLFDPQTQSLSESDILSLAET